VLVSSILELIRETATNLPADVVEALMQAHSLESKNSKAKLSLGVILKNIQLAQRQKTPICQDTGAMTFFVKANPAKWQRIEKAIGQAVDKATKAGILRANSVDILTGKNVSNLSKIEFQIPPDPPLQKGGVMEIGLLLKGGGSENVSGQVSLPMETDFGFAARDLDGVRKVVLQIVKDAGGKGCAPGIISVVVGGDRASAFTLAKKNLVPAKAGIGEKNTNSKLAKLEAEILREANDLKIGAMGLGGKTTLLDCKIDVLNRHPASYFVTVAYSCWATRRGRITLDSAGKTLKPKFSSTTIAGATVTTRLQALHNIKKIQLPVSEKEIRKLRAGDVVSLSGKVFTARDRVHDLACKKKLPKSLKDLGAFHCGPIMIKQGKHWHAVAAGPTTSARLDSFTPKFLEKTGARVLIGKGGMGEATAQALKKFGGVYLHAIGGAAAFYAGSIKKVHGVDFLAEFGMPEALWSIGVEDFLAIVGIDSSGKYL
jgi:fumarate hydratase, class I